MVSVARLVLYVKWSCQAGGGEVVGERGGGVAAFYRYFVVGVVGRNDGGGRGRDLACCRYYLFVLEFLGDGGRCWGGGGGEGGLVLCTAIAVCGLV